MENLFHVLQNVLENVVQWGEQQRKNYNPSTNKSRKKFILFYSRNMNFVRIFHVENNGVTSCFCFWFSYFIFSDINFFLRSDENDIVFDNNISLIHSIKID